MPWVVGQTLPRAGGRHQPGIVVPRCFAHLRGASAPPGCTGRGGVAVWAVGCWGMPPPPPPAAADTLSFPAPISMVPPRPVWRGIAPSFQESENPAPFGAWNLKNLWMPHSWNCPRPDWMGLGEIWFSGRCPTPWQGVVMRGGLRSLPTQTIE